MHMELPSKVSALKIWCSTDLPHQGISLGGKAQGLLWLQAHQFNVPEWFLLSAEFFAAMDVATTLNHDLFVEKIRYELMRLKPDKGPWCVRSSAVGEDGVQHSYAGMYESVLNLHTVDAIARAVVHVYNSQFSDRVVSYESSAAQQNPVPRMSVILQKMIPAEISGVLFSADPVTGNRSHMRIAAVPGLGDQLVSGQVDAEEVVLQASGLLPLSTVGHRVLSAAHVQSLALIGQKIFQQYQTHVDVEWCFHQDRFFCLQVRPLTTALLSDQSHRVMVFDRSNIQESYPGVTTPLTFSYAVKAYKQVYDQMMRLMNLSEREIRQAEFRHQHMLGLVQGQMYYNINSWYEGLIYLPHFGKRKQDMERMMGLDRPVDFIEDQTLTTLEKIKRIPTLMSLYGRLLFRFSRIEKYVHEFDQWFWKLYHSVDRVGLARLSTDTVMAQLEDLQRKALEKWGIPILNDFYVMLKNGSVVQQLKSVDAEAEYEKLIQDHDVESMKPIQAMYELAAMVETDSQLFVAMQIQGRDRAIKLMKNHQDFYRRCQNFIELYGDRVMGELKLETITYREEPEAFYDMIRQFAVLGLGQKQQTHSQGEKERKQELIRVCKKKFGFFAGRRFQKNLEQLKNGIAYRELMRMHRTRIFGLMRTYYLELGRRMVELKALQDYRDVFYLTLQEIHDYFYGLSVTQNTVGLVELRKRDFVSMKEKKTDSQVHVRVPVQANMDHAVKMQNREVGDQSQDRWNGLGCSRGQVVGEVKFVQDLNDIQNLSGKIMLAERTDPGWTPLFALVKGLVIEKGSALSHASIIAREMNLPAVIGIPEITQKLKTGDWIEIRGEEGVVVRSEPASYVQKRDADIESQL